MPTGLPDLHELISRPEHYIQNYPLYRWYKGKIEDVADPDKLGRVRVRVEEIWNSSPTVRLQDLPGGAAKAISLGIPADTIIDTAEQVKTEDLYWADIMCTGQGDHFGCFSVPPVGTAVVVGFEKGQEEHPFVIGGWWGLSKSESGQPEIPIAARGGDQTGETANDLKGKDGDNPTVDTADGGTIEEPDNPYAAEYPQNTVYRTTSGHLVEFDNTKDKERINIAHKSGSWAEFHPDGTLVFGIQGKRYTVIESDDELHVKGKQHIVIDNDATRKVNGKFTELITGELDETIEGDASTLVKGNYDTNVEKGHKLIVTDNSEYSVGKDLEIEANGKGTLKSVGDLLLQSSGGKLDAKAAVKTTLTSPTIQFTGVNPAPATGGGEVVTTTTHPLDYITGIPILGVSGFKVQ
jgi:hypothetical protein